MEASTTDTRIQCISCNNRYQDIQDHWRKNHLLKNN